MRFFLHISYLACPQLSILRLCSPHVSPQFCHTVVQESQPVVHRLRLPTSQYRNLNLLSIGYVFRPRLRPRLTQGRSALPWKPWIFGHEDSHLILATHSGILSSIKSTAPSGTASSLMQCSSTNLSIPQLRCRVSAPDIFGAGPLDQ